ncbi:MAG: hypothetical protein WA906_00945 [Pacificimonas sp.]
MTAPLDLFAEFDALRGARPYHVLPDGVATMTEQVDRLDLIEMLAERLPESFAISGLPREFRPLIEDVVPDILSWWRDAVSSSTASHNLFAKDVAILTVRMILSNGRLLDPWGALGFSFFGKLKPLDAARLGLHFAKTGGGKDPIAEVHLHQRFGRHFAGGGKFEEFLSLAGALAKHDPRIGGLIAGGWFFDPRAIALSDNLSFLRQVEGAAYFAESGKAADAVVAQAISTSERRRAAYDDGTYVPTMHWMVIGRSDLLKPPYDNRTLLSR